MTHYKSEIGAPLHIEKKNPEEYKVMNQGLLRKAGEIERRTGIPCEGRTKVYLQWYVKKYG